MTLFKERQTPMLRISATLLLVTVSNAFAAPPDATCNALNRIVADAPNAFKNLPHHAAKGAPYGVPEPLFPNGAYASLSPDYTDPAHRMQFAVTVFHGPEKTTPDELLKRNYQDFKHAVTTCVAGVTFAGETDDLERTATFIAPNGTKIEVAYALGTAHVPVMTVTYNFVSPPPPQAAASMSAPDAFVRMIYDTYYRRGMEGGVPDSARSALFTPSLLALTRNNTDRDGGPIYDADPFTEAQEIAVSSVRVSTVSTAGDQAVVDALVTNEGQTKRITLHLLRINSSWKVDDVGDLRRVFMAAHR